MTTEQVHNQNRPYICPYCKLREIAKKKGRGKAPATCGNDNCKRLRTNHLALVSRRNRKKTALVEERIQRLERRLAAEKAYLKGLIEARAQEANEADEACRAKQNPALDE